MSLHPRCTNRPARGFTQSPPPSNTPRRYSLMSSASLPPSSQQPKNGACNGVLQCYRMPKQQHTCTTGNPPHTVPHPPTHPTQQAQEHAVGRGPGQRARRPCSLPLHHTARGNRVRRRGAAAARTAAADHEPAAGQRGGADQHRWVGGLAGLVVWLAGWDGVRAAPWFITLLPAQVPFSANPQTNSTQHNTPHHTTPHHTTPQHNTTQHNTSRQRTHRRKQLRGDRRPHHGGRARLPPRLPHLPLPRPRGRAPRRQVGARLRGPDRR